MALLLLLILLDGLLLIRLEEVVREDVEFDPRQFLQLDGLDCGQQVS